MVLSVETIPALPRDVLPTLREEAMLDANGIASALRRAVDARVLSVQEAPRSRTAKGIVVNLTGVTTGGAKEGGIV